MRKRKRSGGLITPGDAPGTIDIAAGSAYGITWEAKLGVVIDDPLDTDFTRVEFDDDGTLLKPERSTR